MISGREIVLMAVPVLPPPPLVLLVNLLYDLAGLELVDVAVLSRGVVRWGRTRETQDVRVVALLRFLKRVR